MNDFSRCRTCRWWEPPAKDADYPPYPARRELYPEDGTTGERLPVPFELRRCDSPQLTAFVRPASPQGAAVVDGEEYFAALYPGPDFGCVNHEPRPANG